MQLKAVMKKLLFTLITVVLVVSAAELAARFAFHRVFPYGDFALRILRGEEGTFQRTIGQSYLNYVPAPDFENESGVQHNSHGYRGSLVKVAKEPTTLRVLCLGGSTTYGWGVERPGQTYPAHLESILGASVPEGYQDVEVINAGLPWGTSAELLTHYQFKFRYYRPDWVVIHTGLNDAQAFDKEYYQPDYSHWRTQMKRLPVISESLLWLTRSRMIDFVLIPVLLGRHPETPSFSKADGTRPDIPWFEEARPDLSDPTKVPTSKIAFIHNIGALVDQIQKDGARVALMPVGWQPDMKDRDTWERRTENSIRYASLFSGFLEEMSDERNTLFVPFPAGRMNPSNWVDPVHLDSEGSRKKAEQVASFMRMAVDSEKPL